MKNTLKYIPFTIACVLVFTHFIQVRMKPAFINYNEESVSHSMIETVVHGSIGLGIVLFLILLKSRTWKFVFLGMVFLTFTPLFSFYNHYFQIGLGSIGIDLTALVLLILHLMFNPEIISEVNFISNFQEKNKKKSEISKKDHFEQSVLRFEKKYNSKKTEELENIVSKNEFVPEAIEAAKRLLDRSK